MRKGRVVTLMVGGVVSVGAWAAAAENPRPEKVANTRQAASKPAPVDAGLPGGKRTERKGTVAPLASGDASKTSLPQLDEKNLGLGCAQP